MDEETQTRYWVCKICTLQDHHLEDYHLDICWLCLGHNEKRTIHHCYNTNTSSNHIAAYLKNCHRIKVKDPSERPPPANGIATYLKENSAFSILVVGKTVLDKLKFLLVRWIVTMHIAFNVVENPFFRALLHWFNPLLIREVLSSHNTIQKYVMEAFTKEKDQIKLILKNAKSNIHLSFDL